MRAKRLTIGVVSLVAAALSTAGVTSVAQDQASGNPICSLLTSDEIAQVFDQESSSPDGDHEDSCWWYVGPSGEITLHVYAWNGEDPSYSFEAWQQHFQAIPDRIVQLEVDGHQAILDRSDLVDSSRTPALVVDTEGGGSLSIQVSGYLGDLDVQDAYATLATLALARLSGGPVPTLAAAGQSVAPGSEP